MFAGKAGTGKTASANIMRDIMKLDNREYLITNFAKRLKEAARLAGWNGFKDAKGRKFLQDLGALGRTYDEDIWVRSVFEDLDFIFPPDSIAVDDWRFPNELKYVQEKESGLYTPVTIRIESPERELLKGTPEENDVSETSLVSFPTENLNYFENQPYNFIVYNTGTLEDLSAKLNYIYKQFSNID